MNGTNVQTNEERYRQQQQIQQMDGWMLDASVLLLGATTRLFLFPL
jgi:hypothetical protein